MKDIYWYSVYLFFMAVIFSGCTSSYHVSETGGGFSITKLADNTYQVHNLSNRHTSQKEISEYILRRCAQMTLEEDSRYFIISSQSQSFSESENNSISYGQVIFKILPNNNQQSIYPILDAITVVKETDAIAGGRLSNKARQTYNKLLDAEYK
ncbi:MAG TPA: hypothetical protein VK112_03965 [Fodinibius sp.]|nr:hypothetical protein [Fodinibius sp.]